MINYPPRGLIADLITPLDQEGRPDESGFRRLMDYLSAEVSGYLAGSLVIGETLAMNLKDRLKILESAVRSGGQKILFFEITAQTREETLELLEESEVFLRAHQPPMDLFYYLTPLACYSNRGLPGHLKEMSRFSRRRIILGNDPNLADRLRHWARHRNIRTSVLKKISTNEQVVGVSYDGELIRALNYQRAVKARSGFRMYDRSEDNFLERPSSSGLISCGANIMPQAWGDIVNSSLNTFDARRLYPDHLSQIWQSGIAVRSMMAAYRKNTAAVIKTVLKMMNIIENDRATEQVMEQDGLQTENLKGLITELHLACP